MNDPIPKVSWTLPVFLHSPMMTIYLDRQPIKGLMDKEENVTILTETEALFPHWKFRTGSSINRVGRKQDSHATISLVHWKDLETRAPFPSK